MWKLTVTQNYADGSEEEWTDTAECTSDLLRQIGATIQSVTATNFVFVICKTKTETER